jgi:hypothetical protein
MKDHRSPLNRTSYANDESKESSTLYVEDTLFVPLENYEEKTANHCVNSNNIY